MSTAIGILPLSLGPVLQFCQHVPCFLFTEFSRKERFFSDSIIGTIEKKRITLKNGENKLSEKPEKTRVSWK